MYEKNRMLLYRRVLEGVRVHGVVDSLSGECFISYGGLRHVLGQHCQVPAVLQPLVIRELEGLGLMARGGYKIWFVVRGKKV